MQPAIGDAALREHLARIAPVTREYKSFLYVPGKQIQPTFFTASDACESGTGAAFMAAAAPVFIGASTGGWLSGRHGPLAIHIKNMRKELIP